MQHARFAVKRRRNLAHYEKRKVCVWQIFKSMMEGEHFEEGFVEGSTFVGIGEHGRIELDFGEEANGES